MATGSAALALKAAALVSVLTLLAVPCLGRCGHSPKPSPPPPPPPSSPPPAAPTPPLPAPPPPAAPAPPPPAPPPPAASTSPPPSPPTPSPAPGPGPTISCNDCYLQCNTTCHDSVRLSCSPVCDSIKDKCDSCFTREIQKCKDNSNCTGSCNECNDAPNGPCATYCTDRYCDECTLGSGLQCPKTCSEKCSAPNCIP